LTSSETYRRRQQALMAHIPTIGDELAKVLRQREPDELEEIVLAGRIRVVCKAIQEHWREPCSKQFQYVKQR
jgi:hypothetical protein